MHDQVKPGISARDLFMTGLAYWYPPLPIFPVAEAPLGAVLIGAFELGGPRWLLLLPGNPGRWFKGLDAGSDCCIVDRLDLRHGVSDRKAEVVCGFSP